METLEKELEQKKATLPNDAKELVKADALKNTSKYPFNKYTNTITVLLANDAIDLKEYSRIRDEYFKRNPNLDLFEMAPRTFGQTWGEEWLKKEKNELKDPHKKDEYEFDLWLPLPDGKGIRIEVKSSHVANDDPQHTLVEKAYKKPKGTAEEVKKGIEDLDFKMNFQQLKPTCCDVFIWLAVWLDDIDIWVIPSSKVIMRPKGQARRRSKDSIVQKDGSLFMSSQHEGGKGGKTPEGEIFVTSKHYSDLNQYKVDLNNLIDKIKAYGSTTLGNS